MMHGRIYVCIAAAFIALDLAIVWVSGSAICPAIFEKGIPFEIYGGTLYPVAIFDPNKRIFMKPFWAELLPSYSLSLVRELQQSNASFCLFDEHPYCAVAFQNITQTVHRIIYQFLDRFEKDRIWEWIKVDSWGVTRFDDVKDNELVRRRRTLLLICLHWCHGLLALPESERPMMKYLCPDPCRQPGLCMTPADVPRSCHLTGEGFFDHQYACKCKPGARWTASIGACTLENEDPCENKKDPPCLPEGTELCSYDHESKEVSCLCKPNFMGDNCSIPANACDDLIRNPLLPNGGLLAAGNMACNVNNDNNRCIASIDPEIGPTYSCVCNEDRWAGDIALSYDNCLKKVTNCDKIICINGVCIDSPDGKEAQCVCNEGYEGSPNCATFTGIWSPWSPWGQCLPFCGEERWALRSRKCLSMKDDLSECHGPSIEFSQCEPHACAVEEGVMMKQYFEVREVMLQATFVLAAVSAIGLTLFWRYKFYPRMAVRIRRNLLRRPEKTE